MARQVHELNYTTLQLDTVLHKADKLPFVVWHDDSAGVYRFFPDEDKKNAWVAAWTTGEMTNEIASYQFVDPIVAPAPYSIGIYEITDNQYVLEGTNAPLLSFTFKTLDSKEQEISESIDVYYTFRSPNGTKTASAIYNAGTRVQFNVDGYLTLGTNTITILIRGRSTGTSKTIVVTYNVIKLELSSNFDISRPVERNVDFDVQFTVNGGGNKTVKIYIDGNGGEYNTEISELVPLPATKVVKIPNNLTPGKHTLQIKASVIANSTEFYSNLLYYEFEVKGVEDTRTLISEIFPPTQTPFIGNIPGLHGEQYVIKKLNWAYYSSRQQSATVLWRLFRRIDDEHSEETTLATRTADVVDAEIGTPPEPLSFMPTEYGIYNLQALIIDSETGEPIKNEDGEPVVFSNYTISVIQNTSGIVEATDGLTMKLSGLGRDNTEPDSTKYTWIDRGHGCTFYNMPFNNIAGYFDNAVVFNNGAYGVINNKPLSINPTINYGAVIEIDFETFDVDDDNAPLLQIGNPKSNPHLLITPTKAILTSSTGAEVIAQFKTDERVKLGFVIYPNKTSDYALKVILFNNGVMSLVIDYTDADNFNIGDSNSSNFGKIIVGDSGYRLLTEEPEDWSTNYTSYYILDEIDEDNENQEIYKYVNVTGNVAPTWAEDTYYKFKDCEGGIKIYYLRTYSLSITMYNEINNFFIDSGENLAKLVAKNNIYGSSGRNLDIDKLETTITTVKVTGDLNSIIGTGGKGKVDCKLEINSPFDSNINLHCDHAQFSNAGQSTLDKPIPSFHVKLDKNGNICYDRDNNMLPKNRWAFRAGNVPEKKFRLQANFMDSSNVHNSAFFRMINDIYPNVKVNVGSSEKYVLRMPAEEYAINEYADAMLAIHGVDPHGNNWKFPYNMHMVPDSIPCIVVYRATANDNFTFLGLYVLMEEKKANYANGMHSIYDGLDADKNPDPFGFNSNKSENRLWDNSNCHQYELLTSTDNETLFLDDSQFNLNLKNTFELIYPDEDDLSATQIAEEWLKFRTEFVSVICSFVEKNTEDPDDLPANEVYRPYILKEGAQEAFNNFYLNGKLVNGHTIKLDRWHFASYYILVLRNCCSDSTARNMEITTYDGVTWLPKWWDVDMQCGLSQTNRCDLLPGMDRTSTIPGTSVYAISGRINDESGYRSSALWDLLEGCDQFLEDVRTMEKALFDAGWTYANMTKIQDEEFVNAWSQSLYNESAITKYINTNDLVSLQGDRTSHRHWFLKTSYDIWDGKHASGTYEKNIVSARTLASNGLKFKVTPGRNTYLGWGTSISSDVTGISVKKGVEHEFTINRALLYNNPLHIYSASNLESINLSGISTTIAAELRVHNTYDEVTGTLLKTLLIGTPFVEESTTNGEPNGMYYIQFNTNPSFSGFDSGADILTRLETLSIQGLTGWKTIPMTAMKSLQRLYAGGSSLLTFNPANSTLFEVLELPTTITAMTMANCKLSDSENHCIIKWFDRVLSETTYTLLTAQPGDWLNNYRAYYYKNTDNEYIQVSSVTENSEEVAPEWQANTYYSKTPGTGYIKKSTVSTTLNYLSFEGMGSDLGVKELIIDWVNAHLEAGTNFNNLRLYCKNVNWSSIELEDLKLIAQIPTVRASEPDSLGVRKPGNLTGYIKINGLISSEDIVDLQAAFGDDIFSSTPGSLAIDASAGFVIGAPESILAGETITITGAIFPTALAGESVYYRLGYPQGDNIIWINPSMIDNKICYPYKNIILELASGKLITTETTDVTHSIVVEGYTLGIAPVSGRVTIVINLRTYPSASSSLTFTWDKVTSSGVAKVSYLDNTDQWSIVLSGGNGINIDITPNIVPNTVNGTLIPNTEYWEISDNIATYFTGITKSLNRFHALIPICPEDAIQGTITHIRKYVSGINFSKTLNFTLKAPKLAISSSVNPPLQAKLYEAEIADNEGYTYDTDLWNVFDISDYLPTNLKHLGELNSFTNISELDVNGLSLLGSETTAMYLENDSTNSHYVDVIPARDITLTIDLTSVDLRNTQVKGINLKSNSSLEEIYYSDYTTEVSLINQDNLEELDLTNVDNSCDVTIDGCDNLETLNI